MGPVEAGRAVPHSPGLASLSMLCLAGSGVGDALGGRLARERVVPPLHASGHVTIPVEHVFERFYDQPVPATVRVPRRRRRPSRRR